MSSRNRRIVIDALAARFGGTAYVTVHLAEHLARSAEVDRVWVVTRRGSIVEQGLKDREQVSLVTLAPGRRFELLRRLAWETVRLPRILRRFGATDVFSLSGMLPLRVAVPLTSYLLNPVALRDRGLGNRLRRLLIRRTSSWAAILLVPSLEMQRLVEKGVDRAADLVPLGVDRATFSPGDQEGTEVLYVADFYPHKRHDILLDAWQALDEPRPVLRLIGNPNVPGAVAESVAAQAELLTEAGVGQIVMDHGLSLDELASAYRRARVTVVPSERESFCMPIAEALSCGVPGVVRDTSVLRETGGEGCDYVAAQDRECWSSAISRVLTDDAHHARLREAGLRHAEGFSFEQMTDTILRHMPDASAE